MRAQTFSSGDQMKAMAASKTLELNPRHPIISALNDLVDTAPDAQDTTDLAHLIYDTALVTSGFIQDEPEAFAERMYRTMATQLSVESMELLDEIEVVDKEEGRRGCNCIDLI